MRQLAPREFSFGGPSGLDSLNNRACSMLLRARLIAKTVLRRDIRVAGFVNEQVVTSPGKHNGGRVPAGYWSSSGPACPARVALVTRAGSLDDVIRLASAQ